MYAIAYQKRRVLAIVPLCQFTVWELKPTQISAHSISARVRGKVPPPIMPLVAAATVESSAQLFGEHPLPILLRSFEGEWEHPSWEGFTGKDLEYLVLTFAQC